MKNAKKTGLTLALVGVLGFSGIMGIRAYLTDSENTTNTFTVGKVQIDGIERNYPGNDSEKVQDITPGSVVEKDPAIKNTGKNLAIGFVSYDIPVAKTVTYAEKAASQTTPKTATPKYHELFTTLIAGVGDTDEVTPETGQHQNQKWTQMKKGYVKADGTFVPMTAAQDISDDDFQTINNIVAVRYLCGYNFILGEEEETHTPVFTKIRLNNFVEGDIDASVQTVDVNFYAIQAENIEGIKDASYDGTVHGGTATTDGTDVSSKLSAVYDLYIGQNGEWVIGDNADNNNAYDLEGNERTANDNTVLNITLSIDDTTLRKGDVAHVAATVNTNLANDSYTLTSDNTSVATVSQDSNGNWLVTAVGTGTANITATTVATDKNGATAKATVSVSVTNRTEASIPSQGGNQGSQTATNG